MLAQRAVWEDPRWTHVVGDSSRPPSITLFEQVFGSRVDLPSIKKPSQPLESVRLNIAYASR